MSTYCKAKILIGYELTNDWYKHVYGEFYDEYADYFVSPNCYDDDVQLFAAVSVSVDEHYYSLVDLSLCDKDQEIINTFPARFPGAVKTGCPRAFIACCEE